MAKVKSRSMGLMSGANKGAVCVSVTVPADAITTGDGTYVFQADQAYRLIGAKFAMDGVTVAGTAYLYKTTTDPDSSSAPMTAAPGVDTTNASNSKKSVSWTVHATEANITLATGNQIVLGLGTYVNSSVEHFNVTLLLLPLNATHYWKYQ